MPHWRQTSRLDTGGPGKSPETCRAWQSPCVVHRTYLCEKHHRSLLSPLALHGIARTVDLAGLLTADILTNPYPMSSLVSFLFYVTTMVVWTDLELQTTPPFPSRRSAPSSIHPAPTARLGPWCGSHLAEDVVFKPLNQKPPFPARLFNRFGRPRVERWRTLKRCSPMSVTWWRWRRANLLQRPGRARKSFCLSLGKHIHRGFDAGLLCVYVCVFVKWMTFSVHATRPYMAMEACFLSNLCLTFDGDWNDCKAFSHFRFLRTCSKPWPLKICISTIIVIELKVNKKLIQWSTVLELPAHFVCHRFWCPLLVRHVFFAPGLSWLKVWS